MGDSDRLRGFLAYIGLARLPSVPSGTRSRLPFSVDDGDGTALVRLHSLSFDVDTSHVRVDEGRAEKDRHCEPVSDYEGNSERRAPQQHGQAYDGRELERIAIRACQSCQRCVAYDVTRPIGRKVGLPHKIVPRARIIGDRAGFESISLRGYRAEDVANLRRHKTNDAFDNLRG